MRKVEDLIVRWELAWEGRNNQGLVVGLHQGPAVGFLDTLSGDVYPFDSAEARIDAVQSLVTVYNEKGYALVAGLENLRTDSTGWLWFQRITTVD